MWQLLSVSALKDLSDVNLDPLSEGDLLSYDSVNDFWTNTKINLLHQWVDRDYRTNEVVFNNGKWWVANQDIVAGTSIPQPLDPMWNSMSASSVAELTDVDIMTVAPVDKDVLQWSAINNKWLPGKVSSESALAPFNNVQSYKEDNYVVYKDHIYHASQDIGPNSTPGSIITNIAVPLVGTPITATLTNNAVGGSIDLEAFATKAKDYAGPVGTYWHLTAGTVALPYTIAGGELNGIEITENDGFVALVDKSDPPILGHSGFQYIPGSMGTTPITAATNLLNSPAVTAPGGNLDNPWESVGRLSKLADVDQMVAPKDGDCLVYDDMSKTWIPYHMPKKIGELDNVRDIVVDDNYILLYEKAIKKYVARPFILTDMMPKPGQWVWASTPWDNKGDITLVGGGINISCLDLADYNHEHEIDHLKVGGILQFISQSTGNPVAKYEITSIPVGNQTFPLFFNMNVRLVDGVRPVDGVTVEVRFPINLDVYGDIDVHDNHILNLKEPIQDTDGVNKKYVDDKIDSLTTGISHGLEVQAITNTPPVNPIVGEIWIVGTSPDVGSVFTAHNNELYWYDGANHHFSIAISGETHLVEQEHANYTFNGTGWVKTSAAVGLPAGTAGQILVSDGTNWIPSTAKTGKTVEFKPGAYWWGITDLTIPWTQINIRSSYVVTSQTNDTTARIEFGNNITTNLSSFAEFAMRDISHNDYQYAEKVWFRNNMIDGKSVVCSYDEASTSRMMGIGSICEWDVSITKAPGGKHYFHVKSEFTGTLRNDSYKKMTSVNGRIKLDPSIITYAQLTAHGQACDVTAIYEII